MDCANACAPSNNKNVRLSVATALLNTSSYIHSSSTEKDLGADFAVELSYRVPDVIGTILGCGNYESEPITRSLVALGTCLLSPGSSGVEVKRVVKERNIGSTLERVASEHGEKAKAIANEILKELAE